MHQFIRISLTCMKVKFHFTSMLAGEDMALKRFCCGNGRNDNNLTKTNGPICLFILNAKDFLGTNSQ